MEIIVKTNRIKIMELRGRKCEKCGTFFNTMDDFQYACYLCRRICENCEHFYWIANKCTNADNPEKFRKIVMKADTCKYHKKR